MIKSFIKSIRAGEDIKPLLPELRSFLKSDEGIKAVKSNNAGFKELSEILKDNLNDPDPKIRKNCASCLGLTGNSDYVDALYEAYLADDTKYNKAAYIEALGRLDFSLIKDRLENRFRELKNAEYAPEDRKHIIEEMHAIAGLLKDGTRHRFTGFELVNEVVLLTNRNFKNITADELGKIPHKEFTAGIMAKTKHIEKVLPIRTYSEMSFVPEQTKTVSTDPAEAAGEIIEGGITDYLKARHDNASTPFYFRVEYKSDDIKEKADFEKKLASGLEFLSRWELINSTDDYDIEFRFVPNSGGTLQFLIGMYTIPDKRFAYRIKTISAGMKPSLAALLVRLGADHIKDNAAVLDPFCGSGIFLAEREMFRPARLIYGIDIYGEAIEAAKANLKKAGLSHKTELINRDILDFRHQYKFDEIYADMPRVTSGKDRFAINNLYKGFMAKAKDLLEDDGVMFIYTHNRDFLRKYALAEGLSLTAEFEISKKEEAYYFIIRR